MTKIVSHVQSDPAYAELENLVARRIAEHKGPLFTTDATGLWEAYLDGLPSDRQHYNCHACRRFIERYGGLCTIAKDGATWSAVWHGPTSHMPNFFWRSIVEIENVVLSAKVTGVFLSSDEVWGTPVTGGWTHLCGRNPSVFKHAVLSAERRMAELREDYGVLCRSVADFSSDVVAQACRVLGSDAMYRSEKAVEAAEWFLGVHASIANVKGPRRSNLLWLATANAPPGFCHVRNNVLGTLLEDLASGAPIEAVQRRWAEKLHPLQYQRPTAAPTEGQVDAAEKLVEKLGVAKSLERRFARLEEVTRWLWKPRLGPVELCTWCKDPNNPSPEHHPDGQSEHVDAPRVFDALRPRSRKPEPVELPTVTVTWEKFCRTVLPSALGIEVEVPARGNFYGLTTAVHPDAPCILQWGNHASSYVYYGGSYCLNWHLAPGRAPVTCIFEHPSRWQGDEHKHHGDCVFFAIEGCWDEGGDRHGSALFPETLKSELHGCRAVIEAHSKRNGLQGKELGTANGLTGWPQTLRVRTREGYANYHIDRRD
jgi:hypothetical protein